VVVEEEVAEENGKEIDYGLAVDPEVAFQTAREAAGQLHECLDRLQAGKHAEEGLPAEAFTEIARTVQLQLLTLRRAHRAMAKAADAGRAVENAARRMADIEHANLEERIFENTCCGAAARRCRNFQTPHLNRLKPLLEGAGEEEDEEEDGEQQEEGENGEEKVPGAGSALAARLEAERVKRCSLFAELEALEQKKAKDVEAFREVTKVTDELFTRLGAVEKALEPVCDILPLRPRPTGVAQANGESLAQLSSPLQIVYAKFDVLAAFGTTTSGSVAVRAEGGEDGKPPPEKRAKLESGAAAERRPQGTVCVEISCGKAAKVVLRFASPHESLVTVAAEGEGGDALAEKLWSGDDGGNASLAAMLPSGEAAAPGRPYGWAQVLAGLRETLLVQAPALQPAEGVTAADVVQRVRARVADKAKA